MQYEEFLELSLKYGKCPNDVSFPSKPLTESRVKKRWEAYCKSINNKQIKSSDSNSQTNIADSLWESVRSIVWKRDFNSCRLWAKLTYDEKEYIKSKSNGLHKVLDCAHIFGRGNNPALKYDSDNVVLLNRYSHSFLDNSRSPITGEYITKEQVDDWWRYIVGEERYESLLKKLRDDSK